MKGTSPSRASRAVAAPATKCNDGKCEFSSTHLKRGSPLAIVNSRNQSRKKLFADRNFLPSKVSTLLASPRWMRAARQTARTHRLAASMPDRHRGVFGRAPRGAPVCRLRAPVRLMAPTFVIAYRLSGKAGKNDAPMRPRSVKPSASPTCASCRPRAGAARPTACAPHPPGVRGATHRHHQPHPWLLSEFGIVLPLKAPPCGERRCASWKICRADTVIGDLLSEVSRLDERIAQYDRHIDSIAKDSEARQLMQLPGVGSTTATALVATIGRG